MTQAKTKPIPKTFREYLDYDDGTDNSYELIDGELIKVPEESQKNRFIAKCLGRKLENFFGIQLVELRGPELEVPPLPGMPKNRKPDLTVMLPEHIDLMGKYNESGITLTDPVMPPPLLVAEVVSPYTSGLDKSFIRDYIDKPQQYSMRGIQEYWIIDPQKQKIEVNWLPGAQQYQEQKTFEGKNLIKSSLDELKELTITAWQVLHP